MITRILSLLFLTLSCSTPAFSGEKNIMGWVEKIIVMPGSVKMKAKLDTGAKTSSIRALIIDQYEKDGDEWITFNLANTKNKTTTLDHKIERWTKIKKKKKGFIRRPVVKLQFCIGHTLIKEEVNLASRAGFVYPVLIGRNMLENHIIVDASKKFTTKPKC